MMDAVSFVVVCDYPRQILQLLKALDRFDELPVRPLIITKMSEDDVIKSRVASAGGEILFSADTVDLQTQRAWIDEVIQTKYGLLVPDCIDLTLLRGVKSGVSILESEPDLHSLFGVVKTPRGWVSGCYDVNLVNDSHSVFCTPIEYSARRWTRTFGHSTTKVDVGGVLQLTRKANVSGAFHTIGGTEFAAVPSAVSMLPDDPESCSQVLFTGLQAVNTDNSVPEDLEVLRLDSAYWQMMEQAGVWEIVLLSTGVASRVDDNKSVAVRARERVNEYGRDEGRLPNSFEFYNNPLNKEIVGQLFVPYGLGADNQVQNAGKKASDLIGDINLYLKSIRRLLSGNRKFDRMDLVASAVLVMILHYIFLIFS